MSDEQRLIHDAELHKLARALLRAGREASPPSESRDRLLSVLAAGGALGLGAASATAAAAKAGWLSRLSVLHAKKLGAVALGGAAVVSAVYLVRAPSTQSKAHPTRGATSAQPRQREPGHAPLGARKAEAASDTRQAGPVGVPEPDPERQNLPAAAPSSGPGRNQRQSRPALEASGPPGASRRATESLSAPTDTLLAAELRELDAVRSALRSGELESARERLESYRTRYPNGYLRPESGRLQQQLLEREGQRP